MMAQTTRPVPAAALIAVLASAVAWGLYWVPLRLMVQAGFDGLWSPAILIAGAVVAMVVALVLQPAAALDRRGVLGALLMGLAMALYSCGLVFSEVVRVVILVYLAPAWSLVIELAFFGRRFGLRMALALALSLAGVVVILRGEIPLQGLGAVGDWLALAAGMLWAAGAALMSTARRAGAGMLTTVALLGSAAVFGVALLAVAPPLPDVTAAPALAGLPIGPMVALGLFAVLVGSLYLWPVMAVTLWGALRLPPAVVSFLLTAEVASGVASSALFSGERFGWPEALGSILIAAGAVVEIIAPARRHAA